MCRVSAVFGSIQFAGRNCGTNRSVSFVETVRPALAKKDLQQSCCKLKSRCRRRNRITAFEQRRCDARKCAAFVLRSSVAPPAWNLSPKNKLKDADPMANQMAEARHVGDLVSAAARRKVRKSASFARLGNLMSRREFIKAIEFLANRAVRVAPMSAEAYNQRAIGVVSKRGISNALHRGLPAGGLNSCRIISAHWAGIGNCPQCATRAGSARPCDATARRSRINPDLAGVQEGRGAGSLLDERDAKIFQSKIPSVHILPDLIK